VLVHHADLFWVTEAVGRGSIEDLLEVFSRDLRIGGLLRSFETYVQESETRALLPAPGVHFDHSSSFGATLPSGVRFDEKVITLSRPKLLGKESAIA